MGEIKSTLDLVMERTKDMVQSDEERRRSAEQEWDNKARGWLLRLLEGELLPGELPNLFKDMEPAAKKGLQKGLIGAMIESLDLDRDNRFVLAGLGVLSGEAVGPLIRRAEEVLKSYDLEKKKLADQAGRRLLRDLAAEGISGSAVKPKFEDDAGYLEADAGLKKNFRGRLSSVRAEMLEKSDRRPG